ncbi:acyltransferase domain-containing protein [Amycolatopsis sp. NPDC024027]|uniref:ACP S-malonyltransferase n=1 Tax=Amycolatopsis sp. NPDC024027 TaxID=3154327 RepID=UPI0033E7A84C
MSARLAFLFPGQGSYVPGLFGQLAGRCPVVADTLSAVDAAVARLGHEPVSPVLLSSGAPSLQQLAGAEPTTLHLAIFTASVVTYRLLTECGVRPDVLLGHSFGDLIALTVSGAWSLDDGVRLVVLGDEALRRSAKARGGMVALDCGARRARALLAAVGERHLGIAADNSPGQVVVSGPHAELEHLSRVAGAFGVSATRLRVPHPFHNAVLAGTAKKFATDATVIARRAPRLRVYSSILGRYVTGPADVDRIVTGHLTMPVRFLDAVRQVQADGVGEFVECGPKGTLTRLVAGTLPGVVVTAPLLRRTDWETWSAGLRAVSARKGADA